MPVFTKLDRSTKCSTFGHIAEMDLRFFCGFLIGPWPSQAHAAKIESINPNCAWLSRSSLMFSIEPAELMEVIANSASFDAVTKVDSATPTG